LLVVPSVGIVVALGASVVAGGALQVEWFLNGDHPRHAVYVADTWNEGALTYAVESYPRGWHSLVAAGWSVAGAGLVPTAVDRLLRIMASACLLLSALLALALASLGMALGRRQGLSRRVSVAVGVAAASASLLNFSLANFQALGYENSLFAAVVLTVCGREVIVRPGSARAVAVCGAGATVIAHSWQLLLPAVGAAFLYCAWRLAQTGRDGAVWVVVTSVVSAAVSFPALVSVVTAVGLGHATEAGPDTPVPVVLLMGGAASVVVLSFRERDGRSTVLAAMTLMPAVTALVMAVVLHVALTDYYPSKLLWHTAVMALPWLASALAVGARATMRSWPVTSSAVRVLGGSAVGLLLLYALLMPWGARLGVWSTVDGDRVVPAVTTPGAARAQVVWLQRTPTDDSVARSLLDIYRVAGTRARVPQARLSVAEECTLLRASAEPTVLSTAGAAAVRGRYACEPRATHLPVVGVRPSSTP
jgi:hypothetical protein